MFCFRRPDLNEIKVTILEEKQKLNVLFGLWLDFCCDIRMVGPEFDVNNMKMWIHHAYMTEFMTMVYPSSCGHFHQDYAQWHKSKIINWSLNAKMFHMLKWPLNSLNPNPTENISYVMERVIQILDRQTINIEKFP